MTIRRPLLAALAATLLLAACGGEAPGTTVGRLVDDVADEQTDPTSDTPAPGPTDPTDAPGTDGAAAPVDDDAEEEAEDGDDPAATAPAAVVLRFDDRTVPVATACNGADGAVLATTEGEVTITLVREEGLAMRYLAEGFTAETDEVVVEEVGPTTVHRATLSSDDVPPVVVELELGDTTGLPDC